MPLWLVVMSFGFLIFFAISNTSSAPEKSDAYIPTKAKVRVILAEPKVQALNVSAHGYVEAKRTVEIVAQVPGQITYVSNKLASGEFFSDNETLIKIDNRDYEYEVVRVEAIVSEAEEALAVEEGRARRAKKEWRDLKSDQANKLFLREPQLKLAKARLLSAYARLDQAKLNLERTTIYTPFNSRIVRKDADIGQYLSVGSPIATVYDTSVVEVRLPLTDKQTYMLDLPFSGAQSEHFTEVKFSAVISGKTYKWDGVIKRIEASVDRRSGMFVAVAEVDNTAPHSTPLHVGLYVDAVITGRDISGVVELPREAIYQRNTIYVVDQNNTITPGDVNVLHVSKEKAWVKGDIDAGAKIVLEKQSLFRPGAEVEPLFDTAASDGSAIALSSQKSVAVSRDALKP